MASIKEVAKIAGVSPATVSRVMNGTAKVDEEKVQRVLSAIRETGFKPNEVARSLFKKSSQMIGVIAPDISNPFFSEMAKAIEGEAYRHGYRMTLFYSENDVEKECESIRMLSSMNADGIILMTNNEELNEEIKSCSMPVVLLDRKSGSQQQIPAIQADHYKGGCLATEHLIACGCKNIVSINGPQKFSSAKERFQGYVDVCRKYGREIQCIECEYDFKAGLEAAQQLTKEYPNVDGVIANNDMVAMSVYKVLNKAGYRIPEDVQLIGFDNIQISQLFTPEITTIGQPIEAMGKEAARMIIESSKEENSMTEKIFPVELIKRDTTILKKEKGNDKL